LFNAIITWDITEISILVFGKMDGESRKDLGRKKARDSQCPFLHGIFSELWRL
jgi:hypothetical protein